MEKMLTTKKKQVELNYFASVFKFQEKLFWDWLWWLIQQANCSIWWLHIDSTDATGVGEEFVTAGTRIRETIALLFHLFPFAPVKIR